MKNTKLVDLKKGFLHSIEKYINIFKYIINVYEEIKNYLET